MRALKTPEEIMCRAEILSNDVTKWSEQEIKLMIIAAQRDALECVAHNVVDTIIEHRQNTGNKSEISAVKINECISNLLPKE